MSALVLLLCRDLFPAEFALQVFAFFGVLVPLSLLSPSNWPNWARWAYLLTAIALIIAARYIGISLDILLYIYIAKGCFLLDRQGLACVVFAAGSGFSMSYGASIPKSIQLPAIQGILPTAQQFFVALLGDYLSAAAFTVLFCFTVMSEQRSRQKAEWLSRRVEILAAGLERARIARDIHDSLGHTLTALGVQLELARKLHHLEPGRAIRPLEIAAQLADESLLNVRRAVQTIRSEDTDLGNSLRTLIQQVKRDHALEIELRLDLPPLPRQTEYQLYCIAQEALTNIQRHAHASKVRVCGSTTPKRIVLSIEDDGQGFDIHTSSGGFGLRGMCERTQLLGGDFHIDTTPGRGTRLEVIVPR
ncbi:MAG: sensor histidine kinase [Aphanocapsa lilacina HA4352-LM1]|nr:sensor histidine kinase [Aphanocapsa lilacina HA4352-LM1]